VNGAARTDTSKRTVTVLVADDQADVRTAFCALIDSARDLQVVAEAATGRQAVDRTRATVPDVVLMDVRMPDLDGIEATRRICSDFALRSTRVIVLTTFDLDEYIHQALRAGASGFLLKDVEPEDLLRAIRVVACGDALLAPRVTRRLLTEFATRPGDPAPDPAVLSHLTDRELDVVRLVALGRSNAEIAIALVISPLTVKTHVSRALAKLGCRDRAQLVSLAFRSCLVRPDESA
jgi:DNA-binding NarL/FixJ family response regulator